MNYFIDFEATQFSNDIISIGCVRENGDQFYSLVNPHKKLTEFIINLTGITNELVQQAPEAEEVFSNFFDWCNEYPNDTPVFYCYGGTDFSFVKHNFGKAKNFKEKSILGYMFAGLRDYAPYVQNHFGLVKLVGLSKVYNYYQNKENIQTHNALDDAMMLKYIYEQINIHSQKEDANAFPEYKVNNGQITEIKLNKFNYTITVFDGDTNQIINKFKNFDEAVAWVKTKISRKERSNVIDKNIIKRIKKANNKHSQYCKCYWTIMEVMKNAE